MNPNRRDRTEFETTFERIAAERGEEAAIQAGIAADPDAWELTDDEIAMLRPVNEVHPDLISGNGDDHRTRVRVFRETENGEETVREFAIVEIDLDIAERFWAGGSNWRERLNDTLREAVFGKSADAAAPEKGGDDKGEVQ